MVVRRKKSVRAAASTGLIPAPEAHDAGEFSMTGEKQSLRQVVRGSRSRRQLPRRDSKRQGATSSRLSTMLNNNHTGRAEDPAAEDDQNDDDYSVATADTLAAHIGFEREERIMVYNNKRNRSNRRTKSQRGFLTRPQLSFKRIPSTSDVYKSFRRKLLSGGNTRKKKKRVRFADDVDESTTDDDTPKQLPLCSYYEYVQPFPIDGSPKDVNPIWFCKTEYRLFRQAARRDIARDGGDSLWKKQYKTLYALCGNAEGAAQVLLRQSAALCSSRHRGLECLLFRGSVSKRHTIRSVLKRQAKLRAAELEKTGSDNDKNGVMDDAAAEEVALALAAHSRAKTLAARRMARILAAGDEYVAQDHLPEAVWDGASIPGLNLMEI